MNEYGYLEQFGKYRIENMIGQGGFGTVYRATDTKLDRPIALKKLDPLLMRDTVWVSRFRREAKMMAKLEHPNIVPIHEIDEIDGQLFIAMKFIDGPNLAERIKHQGRLEWGQIVHIVQQIGLALDYANSLNVVHRDLKPSNVLLKDQYAYLTDFGFARVVGDNSHSITVSGSVVGTPAYIAPEIWEGKTSDRTTDYYALGCILYEMVMGQVLFQGDSVPSIMLKHFKPPPLPSRLPADVPAHVIQVIEKALARNPADRYTTAKEMLQALNIKQNKEPSSDISTHLKEAARLALDKLDLVKARTYINSLREAAPNSPEIAPLVQRYKQSVESLTRKAPVERRPPEPTVSFQQSDYGATKRCAYCAEEIKAMAKVCRYCKREQPSVPPRKNVSSSDFTNTSGQGKLAVVPQEAQGWHWGAFLLNWIWGLGNNSYIALLCLIPYVNLVMVFVVGAKGKEWAWRNKQWDSIEHFTSTQKKWTKWGAGIWIASFILSFLIIIAAEF
ncbi:MAG: serine/threonine protein kinase [Chloroflexi bacterium]|nr:MAG: serine/threonine protein kinase [Chloroflexota bacterium]